MSCNMQTATHVRNTEISACLSWVELSLPVLQPWNNACLKTKSRKNAAYKVVVDATVSQQGVYNSWDIGTATYVHHAVKQS